LEQSLKQSLEQSLKAPPKSFHLDTASPHRPRQRPHRGPLETARGRTHTKGVGVWQGKRLPHAFERSERAGGRRLYCQDPQSMSLCVPGDPLSGPLWGETHTPPPHKTRDKGPIEARWRQHGDAHKQSKKGTGARLPATLSEANEGQAGAPLTPKHSLCASPETNLRASMGRVVLADNTLIGHNGA
jgi:hypothetical protein